MDGESLKAKATHNSSEFHKLVYTRCANFLIYDFQKPVSLQGEMVRYVYGLAALREHMKELENTVAGNKPIDLGALKIFRQFRWLLSNEEDDRTQKLLTEARRKRQNFLENRMIKDVGLESGGDGNAHDKSTSGAVVHVGPVGPNGAKGSTDGLNSSSSSSTEKQPSAKKAKLTEPGLDARMALFLPKFMAVHGKKP